jgi:large subunit ribosomal protein L30
MSRQKGKGIKGQKVLRITLTKSPIGYSYRQKRTVRALGLRRMRQTVEQEDTPVIRGMIAKVSHLVTVEEVLDG